MSKNVILLPKTSNQKLLAEYYSLADVFVICSKRENFPTTCIEAQCCGTQVVGFDAGGTKETTILSEEDFVPYGDVELLAQKVKEALMRKVNDLSMRAQLIYSKQSMSKKYLEEYDKDGRKERILLIDVNCKNSSTGKIVYDLYQSICQDGRTAAICYGRGEKIKGENIFKFGLDFETYFHAAMARVTGLNGYYSFFSTRRLIKYIEEFKPDLIHINELHAYFVNIKPLIKYIKEKKIPVVWTFHCEYMYTGKCGHAYECTRFISECNNCPALRDYPKSLIFDRTQRMFCMKKDLLEDWDFTIITPSSWLANRVKMSFLKDKTIDVIHNGINTSIFEPMKTKELREKLHINDNQKVILALAPDIMSENKGGKWVLELAQKMESENVMFLIVGVNE